jgi:hypothetical protein
MPIIPKIQQQQNIKSVCVVPDKEMAQCIAETIIKTNCVKCSLENCDKNHILSTSCYENEKHSHNPNNQNNHNNYNNHITDYYSTNNLHEYNSIDNLNQENTHIIYRGMNNNLY